MAQQNSGQQSTPLIKPGQVDGLPVFLPEQKQHYKIGLTRLWNDLENATQGSPQHKHIEQKIREASMKIMQQISQGNRPNSGAGPQRPQQQGGGGGQQQQQQPQQQQQQGGMPQGANMATQGSQQGGQPQQPQQQQQPQQMQMSNATRQELQSVKINIPPQVLQQGEQAANQYRTQWYKKGASLLTKREQAKQRGSTFQAQQRQGQGNPQQLAQELEKCKTDMYQAHNEWESMKTKNSSLDPSQAQNMQRQPSAQGQGQGQNQQQNQQPQQQQPQAQQAANQTPQQGQQQQQQGDVKMQDAQGASHSPAQPQAGFQQQQGQTAQGQATQQQTPASARPQPTPQNATQPHPQQGFPQQNNMQQPQQPNQQQRQPMNPQQMAQAQQNMAQAQQQRQQQPGMPQGATQQQPPQQPQQQQPQPLSHQAAVSQAAQSYSREQAQNQQQQQQQQQQQPAQQNAQVPQVPNGLPLNQPPSATQQTPPAGYPALQQQSQNASASTKFPIPKQLNLDPRTQAPVPGPPSRPTYSTPGMMQQPGVQRAAQFTLEGEGDRVLSKRKLDELVRQVTGTASSDDTNVLSPDVEESVLTLADNFVDNVIVAACRLAKLRSSQTLDVRDIQMVLERNYGIRIPGYGLDEVRTVRKFQPAPGWQTKMQAVQAGKVMGGVGNRDT